MEAYQTPTTHEIDGIEPSADLDVVIEGEVTEDNDAETIRLARDLRKDSTDWFDTSLRSQLVKNQYNFQSKHPPGSKYYTHAFAKRARNFRPKTRTGVRRHDASAVKAFFSTNKAATVTAEDPSNPVNVASAALIQQLMLQHLRKSMPWFLTCIGGYQDAQVQGVVCSKQYWDFGTRYINGKAVTDAPACDLIPLENLRFDPASDWRDVVGTTPYLIHINSMTVGEVLDEMEAGRFETYSEGQILSANRELYNTVRHAREGERADTEEVVVGNEYSIVYPAEFIVRDRDGDKCFWMLGDSLILQRPAPLQENYLHGIRPYTIGFCNLETHKAIPAAPVEITSELQAATNDVANLRMDSLRLAALKRFKYIRGRNVDIEAMRSGVPGGGIAMTNMRDVEMLEHRDVNQSAYAEQDRLNLDFDDLMGAMSGGTIQANRAMNETVGGMQMASAGYDAISDFQLTVFAQTWVAPTLYQIVALIQAYEDDRSRLRSAYNATVKYNEILDQMGIDEPFHQELGVQIDVGAAATSPQARIQNMMLGVQTTAQLPGMGHRLNSDEVADEIWGQLGYADASRFYKPAEAVEAPPPPPEIQKIMLEREKAEAEFQLEERKLMMQRENLILQLMAKGETDVKKIMADLAKHRQTMSLGYEREANKLTAHLSELEHARTEGEGRGI